MKEIVIPDRISQKKQLFSDWMLNWRLGESYVLSLFIKSHNLFSELLQSAIFLTASESITTVKCYGIDEALMENMCIWVTE